jgi:glutathione S-transferase
VTRTDPLCTVQAAVYKVQAAKRLVENHTAVIRFSLRAVGKPGRRFYAPLAEPDAVSDMQYEAAVSAALQLTAAALLKGTDDAKASLQNSSWLGEDAAQRRSSAETVCASLSYLRDRVGVPRDLQLPAARQLRAHLNWTIDAVTAAV